MRHTPNKSMFSMPFSVAAASILQNFLSHRVVPLLFIAAVAMPAFAGSNSRWYVLAYGGKGEMHGEPICHALAYFSESPLPLDLDGDYSGEKPGDLKTQAKVTLLGTMNGRRVFEVKQTVYRRAGARPDAPDANLPPSMKILLVERRAGEFCDIYQNQYAYDPTNEIDQAAILDIGGRKVLKTYETDMHTWFLAYWAMDGLGPLSLNPDALYTAISSASPAGTLPFRGALNLVGSHFTVDISRYNQFMRLAVFASLFCACSPFFPRRKSPSRPPAPTSTLDKAHMEAYVRHLLAVIPEVQVKIDDPKPSGTSDLQEVDVHFTYQGRSQDETFYITKDGQHIIRGVVYNLARIRFRKISTS
jgi:hypothetical protein